MAWRRAKIVELKGIHNFRREYPATPEEAFSAEVAGALWKREQIDNLRVLGGIPELKHIVAAVDPSGGDKARNDEVASSSPASMRRNMAMCLPTTPGVTAPRPGPARRSRFTANSRPTG